MNTESTQATPVHKVNRSYSLTDSDRVQLLNSANCLIEIIQKKQLAHLWADKTCIEPLELSPSELRAYEAALDYATRQWRMGYKEPEIIETGISYPS